MQLIDTHVHINFDVFQGNLNSLKQRWQEAGVVHLVHSCVEPNEFQGIQSLADRFPELSFAVGLHPLDVDKWTENTAEEILTLARSDSRVVAIGETGLDFYKSQHGSGISRENAVALPQSGLSATCADAQRISSRQDFDLQKLVFQEHLKIAKQLNLPVIIHCRDAAKELRDLLQDFWQTYGAVPGVMHCWGGDEIETQWFLDLGFYISFSGILTFKNARQVKASAAIVPDDRLLIETDCPFLAPVPRRGKTNEPSYVRYVAEYLAQLRGVSLETIAQQTTANACSLFKLDSSRFLPNQQFCENFNNTLN